MLFSLCLLILASANITASAVDTTSVSVDTTGVSVDTTGVSVDTTGVTVDTTDVTVDTTGVTVDTVLVSITDAGRWEKLKGQTSPADVGSVYPDRSGALWLILSDRVVRVVNGVETVIDTTDGLFHGTYSAFAESNDGRKWIAGDHHGRLAISWSDGDDWKSLVSDVEGRLGEHAAVDVRGRIWVKGRNPNFFTDRGGTGVYRFDGRSWTNFREATGLTNDRVYDVVAHRDGSVWIATFRGISRYQNDTWHSYRSVGLVAPLLHGKTYRLLIDDDDQLWALHGYKGVSVYDGESWRHIDDGMPVERTRVAVQLRDGTIWFSIHPHDISDQNQRGIMRYDGESWTMITESDGLPVNRISDLIAMPDGSLLILSERSDAVRFIPTPHNFARISGSVHLPKKSFRHIPVHAVTADGIIKAGSKTRPDGTFDLTVAPGTYTIEIGRSIGEEERKVEVAAGEHATGIAFNPSLTWDRLNSPVLIGLAASVVLLVLFLLPILFVARRISRRPLPDDVEPSPDARPMDLSFHGQGGDLFGIYIVNVFLTIITLGVYYFWGKARIRRYIYSQTSLVGDRFTNHTTGRELFVGWIKAMLFILILTLLTKLPSFFSESATQETIALVAFYALLIAGFVPFAIIGSWRFRMSRSEWRGIRLSFRGRGRPFFRLYLTGLLKTFFSLGLYYPYFETEIRWYLTGNTRYGTGSFDFDGEGRYLFKHFILALLLTPVTIGFYWFWYQAMKTRYYWSRTTFEGIPFRSTVTGSRLLALRLGNALILILTLGIARSWVTVRNSRFLCEYIFLTDTPDLKSIGQDYESAEATGEGLSDYLDFQFEF